MYFDFSAFFRYNFLSFFKSKGKHYRLTPKRFLVLVIWLTLYIPAQIINRIFFLLDDIFYPKYRQQQVVSPVFIIGNPRSGTTFLHQLMYKDSDTFTALTVWEMLVAPSITQRKLIWGLIKLGKLVGYPVNQGLNRINKRINRNSTAHSVRLDEAEEDEFLLMHSWTSMTLWPLYPIKEELFAYFFYDRDIPVEKKNKINKFYKQMIQRHLYAHGGNRTFLSKNPSHTAKIDSLLQLFPDARFIDLVRNPYEAMPSMLDYMSIGWKFFCDPLEPYPHRDEFYEVMNFYYLYPVNYFQDKSDKCRFIRYEELVANPLEIIEDIYPWLGLDLSEKFNQIVITEMIKASQYQSKHEYSIETMELSEHIIYREFDEVFSYFEFDDHNQELPDHLMLWKMTDWAQNWKVQRLERKRLRHQRRIEKKSAGRSRKKIETSHS